MEKHPLSKHLPTVPRGGHSDGRRKIVLISDELKKIDNRPALKIDKR